MPEPLRRDAVPLLATTGLTTSTLAATGDLTTTVAVASAFAGLVIPLAAMVSVSRRRPPHYGPADAITLVRAALAGGITTLVGPVLLTGAAIRHWEIVVLAVLALALDGIDGLVARHTGTESGAGARLDLEIDAALAAITVIPVAMTVGWWALPLGYLRYLFALAARFQPAFLRPMPPSRIRKAIGAVQTIALAIALVPALPMTLRATLVAITLVAVLVSFTRDIASLLRASGID